MTEIGQRRHTEAEVTTEKEHSRPKSPSALSFQNLPHPLEPRSLASPGLWPGKWNSLKRVWDSR